MEPSQANKQVTLQGLEPIHQGTYSCTNTRKTLTRHNETQATATATSTATDKDPEEETKVKKAVLSDIEKDVEGSKELNMTHWNDHPPVTNYTIAHHLK